jgi:cbb3-type cytochrome oxidase maturation protein
MNVVLILLAASLTIAVGFLIAFIWSVKNGQYEDDYTPSVRMLFDETLRKNTDSRARDAEGLALFVPTSSGRDKKAEAIAEPEAARPGAQKSKTAHPNNENRFRFNKVKSTDTDNNTK